MASPVMTCSWHSAWPLTTEGAMRRLSAGYDLVEDLSFVASKASSALLRVE